MTMFEFMRKQGKQFLSLALVGTLSAGFAAGAADTTAPQTNVKATVVLSSKLSSNVGTVLSSSEVLTAEQALAREKARAEAEAKAKAEAEAKAKAEAEAKAKAEAEAEAALAAYNSMLTSPVGSKTVAYSASNLAGSIVKENATALGNYKLTFYCPCAVCNGRSDGVTASGTTMAEGRTIAVDTSVIPLGSRVYIDGYGVFIAEDTGGAIKSNKLDICVSSHSRAYELGVQYADVYLLS